VESNITPLWLIFARVYTTFPWVFVPRVARGLRISICGEVQPSEELLIGIIVGATGEYRRLAPPRLTTVSDFCWSKDVWASARLCGEDGRRPIPSRAFVKKSLGSSSLGIDPDILPSRGVEMASGEKTCTAFSLELSTLSG
jgi:hypothetical protein